MLKSSAFTWLKTAAPTTIVTGIVTRSPAVPRITCPVKVPAINPSPGKLAGFTLTVGAEGAVPLALEVERQAPPSAVLSDAVQASEPAPAFLISSG